jgi:hypothetical protein
MSGNFDLKKVAVLFFGDLFLLFFHSYVKLNYSLPIPLCPFQRLDKLSLSIHTRVVTAKQTSTDC